MKDYKLLYEKYLNIKNKGWLSVSKTNPGDIGCTFEKMIGKETENFPIPDYNGIEIKTICQKSYNNITLFSLTPDGDYLFPIKRILEKIGYPIKEYPQYKALNSEINAKNYTMLGYYKKVKLNINYEKEKLEVKAFRTNGTEIPLNISWSFKYLEERLLLKLKKLALIDVMTKIEKGQKYAYYYDISFYELKDFKTFLNLIENGVITVTFKISIYKSGKKFGQIHDRGTGFVIKKENINLLFKEIPNYLVVSKGCKIKSNL